MRFATRIVLTLLAVTVVVGMGIHYDIMADRHRPYPGNDDLAADYEEHLGEKTLLFGTVVSVDESAEEAEIEVEYTDGVFTMTVRNFKANVEPGGTVQVFGTLGNDYSLAADRVVIVNPSSDVELMKFGLSGLGALVVLIAIFSQWRVDMTRFALESR